MNKLITILCALCVVINLATSVRYFALSDIGLGVGFLLIAGLWVANLWIRLSPSGR